MKTEETKKQLKNLFGKLTKDSKRLFYLVEKINRNLLNKARKSVYEKDKVFTNFIMKLKIVILFLMKKTKKYLFTRRLLSRKRTLINRQHFTVSKHHLSCFMQI